LPGDPILADPGLRLSLTAKNDDVATAKYESVKDHENPVTERNKVGRIDSTDKANLFAPNQTTRWPPIDQGVWIDAKNRVDLVFFKVIPNLEKDPNREFRFTVETNDRHIVIDFFAKRIWTTDHENMDIVTLLREPIR